MGLIIRESYTYQEDGQQKGALYLMEGDAFDDPAQLRAPEGQGKSGGDRRSTVFNERRRCPEHPDAPVRVTTHRTAEYQCLRCAEELGEEPESFFIEDLPPTIRTVVQGVDLTDHSHVDDTQADADARTGFKFETNLREQFKTETLLPSDELGDGAERVKSVGREHVSKLKPDPPIAARANNDNQVGPSRLPFIVDDPSTLPGVRSGLLAPDDPWVEYQRALRVSTHKDVT